MPLTPAIPPCVERLRFSRPAGFSWLRLLLLMLLFGTLSSCATLGNQQPQFKVLITSMTPLESTLMEQRYLVKLRIQNRSDQPLTIDGMSFDLKVNGKAFASGVSNQQVIAEAYGEAMLEAKASSTLFGMLRQLQSMQESGSPAFQYEISGNLRTPESFFSLPFRESGEIDLSTGPKNL